MDRRWSADGIPRLLLPLSKKLRTEIELAKFPEGKTQFFAPFVSQAIFCWLEELSPRLIFRRCGQQPCTRWHIPSSPIWFSSFYLPIFTDEEFFQSEQLHSLQCFNSCQAKINAADLKHSNLGKMAHFHNRDWLLRLFWAGARCTIVVKPYFCGILSIFRKVIDDDVFF